MWGAPNDCSSVYVLLTAIPLWSTTLKWVVSREASSRVELRVLEREVAFLRTYSVVYRSHLELGTPTDGNAADEIGEAFESMGAQFGASGDLPVAADYDDRHECHHPRKPATGPD